MKKPYLPIAKRKITEIHPIKEVNSAITFDNFPDGIPLILKQAYETIEKHLPKEYKGGATEAIYTGRGNENESHNGFKRQAKGDWYLYKVWTHPKYRPLFIDIHRKDGIIASPQFCDFDSFKLQDNKKYIRVCKSADKQGKISCNWKEVKK